MIDTWNPAKLNEKISGHDSWNPAILNEAVTDRDTWNPAILNESAGETPVVFSATITASFPEGATCTATDGTITLTADDNPMAFSIPNEGTWAVACVANGVTFSNDVVITTNGQAETVDLNPVGDTYATTDSVGVLIACAGIGDSEITTIAGALADVETLTAILESENAIDYLVRSTTFANDVTADSVAMTGIGAINYDADTLLADSTWLAAICNSTYVDSVLNVKVPAMTSNTTPSGECGGSTRYDSNYEYYKAFNGNNESYGWLPADNDSLGVAKVYYHFPTANKIYKADMYLYRSAGVAVRNAGVKIKGSNDGTNWVDVSGDVAITNFNQLYSTICSPSITYEYYCMTLESGTPINAGTGWHVQFYGRTDVE